jgi:hypothetical protein
VVAFHLSGRISCIQAQSVQKVSTQAFFCRREIYKRIQSSRERLGFASESEGGAFSTSPAATVASQPSQC